jgi:PAS domain S-box-containing protein
VVLLTADVLDALPTAVVLIDDQRRVAAWNGAAEILYGRKRVDTLGQPALVVLFDGDDRETAEELFELVAAEGPWEGDARVTGQEGSLLVSSFLLTPVGDGMLAWIATDGMDQGLAEQERSVRLSAEHAARNAAEAARGLMEAVIAAVPVAIAVFDLDLRYVRVNDAYAALSGVSAADHVGGRLGEVLPMQADVAADLRRVLTTGRTILGRHLELLDVQGVARHFTVSYFPVSTSGGSRVGAGLTAVDVTESRRAEVERAALLLRAEQAQQRLSILATASTVLTTTMELEELLLRLTRVLTPAAADWCIIQLFGARGEIEHVAVSHRDRGAAEELAGVLRAAPFDTGGAGPVAQVLRTGQARLLEGEELAAALPRAASDRGVASLAERYRLQASVLVPIEARSEVLGVLILSTEAGRVLEDDDLDLAVEIAHRAALAVGNARAFQQEHQIAETLQRALLPATVPSVPGLDLAVRYLAATDRASVGGDWYDVLAFEDGSTGLVVGDVIGHDVVASTSMGQLRSALRAYAFEDHHAPADTLARVDRRFASLGLTYATCVFGILEAGGTTFRWSNAGHPPPLLVRDGIATYLTDGGGVLFGVLAGAGVAEGSVEVQDGDLLVLYTDGLIERRGESLQSGLERLARVALTVGDRSSDSVCEALVEALAPSSTAREDDVAILVVRIGGGRSLDRGHRLPFELRPASASLARGFTAGILHQAGLADMVDTAVLLVSELVTNAVRHTKGSGALVVTVGDEVVEFAVEDGDPRPPEARHPSVLDEGGRGFLLVEALGDEWGVRFIPGGKATWFTLSRSQGEGGLDARSTRS